MRLSELPADLIERWVTSADLQPGWTDIPFYSRQWVLVKPLDGVAFPNAVVDETGNRYPPFEPERAEQIQWVFRPFWHPREQRMRRWIFFRRAFDFTEAFGGCASYLSVDDEYEFYVNGTQVGSGSQDAVTVARVFAIDRYLRPGPNVLALAARNMGSACHVLIWTDLHQAFPVRRDRPMRWVCSTRASPGWEQPSFVPRDWVKAVPVDLHIPVQGAIDTTPIWYPGNQERHRIVYFRFPFDIDGLPNYGMVDLVADNAWELYVNGQAVALEKRHLHPAVSRTVIISDFLRSGQNVIAVKAYNYGGPAALACLPKVKVSF
jgi:hypothetical protein